MYQAIFFKKNADFLPIWLLKNSVKFESKCNVDRFGQAVMYQGLAAHLDRSWSAGSRWDLFMFPELTRYWTQLKANGTHSRWISGRNIMCLLSQLPRIYKSDLFHWCGVCVFPCYFMSLHLPPCCSRRLHQLLWFCTRWRFHIDLLYWWKLFWKYQNIIENWRCMLILFNVC